MTHWAKSNLTKDSLLKEFPWLKDYVITVEFKDFNWLGACAFAIDIKPNATNKKTGRMTINLCEQAGCCGYSNFLYPSYTAPFDAKTWMDVAMHCADQVHTSGVQYVGTDGECKTSVMKEMAARGWKKVHTMPNKRYSQQGTQLTVLCVNLNAFKSGKPVRPRVRKGIYG